MIERTAVSRRSVSSVCCLRSGDHLDHKQYQETDKKRGGNQRGIGYLMRFHQQFFRHEIEQGCRAEREHRFECSTQ